MGSYDSDYASAHYTAFTLRIQYTYVLRSLSPGKKSPLSLRGRREKRPRRDESSGRRVARHPCAYPDESGPPLTAAGTHAACASLDVAASRKASPFSLSRDLTNTRACVPSGNVTLASPASPMAAASVTTVPNPPTTTPRPRNAEPSALLAYKRTRLGETFFTASAI